MVKFNATIYKIGINPVVDPPDRVLEAIFRQAAKKKGPIPVRGRLSGVEFKQTLVKYQGVWRLYTNGQMLRNSGLKIGDEAHIDIEFDPLPREYAVPHLLEITLKKNGRFRDAFEALTPSRRTDILRYLGSLKTKETLRRNIEKLRVQLVGK